LRGNTITTLVLSFKVWESTNQSTSNKNTLSPSTSLHYTPSLFTKNSYLKRPQTLYLLATNYSSLIRVNPLISFSRSSYVNNALALRILFALQSSSNPPCNADTCDRPIYEAGTNAWPQIIIQLQGKRIPRHRK
jgi:hypothetical protein